MIMLSSVQEINLDKRRKRNIVYISTLCSAGLITAYIVHFSHCKTVTFNALIESYLKLLQNAERGAEHVRPELETEIREAGIDVEI